MNDNGIYKLDNGGYGFRVSVLINGKRYSKRKTVDEFGRRMIKKTDAIKARERALSLLIDSRTHLPVIVL